MEHTMGNHSDDFSDTRRDCEDKLPTPPEKRLEDEVWRATTSIEGSTPRSLKLSVLTVLAQRAFTLGQETERAQYKLQGNPIGEVVFNGIVYVPKIGLQDNH